MISRLEPLEVDKINPFKHCKLGRLQYAEILTQIVGSYEQGCVLAIDGQWGSGKTTFMSMWKQMLENSGFKALYFNVWEHDFMSDPLIGLVAELQSQLGEGSGDNLEKVMQAGAGVMSAIVKHAAKKYIGEEATELVEGIINSSVKIFKKEISEYNEQCKSIDNFREALSAFVADYSKEKPLVFIVDELDRCNPSYAVKVLERIKHLFTIPNVVFVLSIDKKQLCCSIKGYYGSESIDADDYLRRFIDIEYLLPQPDVEKFVDYLYKAYGFETFFNHPERVRSFEFNHDGIRFEDMSKYFFTDLHLSLRQMERIYSQMRLTMQTFGSKMCVHPELLLILYYIRIKDAELYEKVRNKELEINELVSSIEILLPKSLFMLKKETDYKARNITNSVGLMLACYARSRNGDTVFELLNPEDNALLFKPEVIDPSLLLEAIKRHNRQGYAGYVFDLSKLMGNIDLLHMLRQD
jgi:hypothetical protein